jgi:tetratricopeptide (TPR) repeat protein
MRMGTSQALADLGRLDEALLELDIAGQSAAGPEAAGAVASRRTELLRRAGRWMEARSAAREATALSPTSTAAWEQRFEVELLVGEPQAVEACIAGAPAVRLDDRIRLLRMQGRWAEAQWRLEAARDAYDEALRLNARRFPWLHMDAARVKLLLRDLAGARANLAEFVRQDRSPSVLKRPKRISHTHFGQILNDLELDPWPPGPARPA